MKEKTPENKTAEDKTSEEKAEEEPTEKEAAENSIEELRSKLEETEKLAEEYRELLLRCRADFENYKKHVERQQEKLKLLANRDLIQELIDVWENLERGLASTGNEGDFRKGIELVASQLWKLLEKQGLEPIKALGQKFDPTFHEALLQTPHEGEDGIVLEELQRGYTLRGEVLRYSKVRVSKKPDANMENKKENRNNKI